MANKFIVSEKPTIEFVNMSLRLEKTLQQAYSELSEKTGRSRNDLMCMALRYALENIEILNQRLPKPLDKSNAKGE